MMRIRRVCLAVVVASIALTVAAPGAWSEPPSGNGIGRSRAARPARTQSVDTARRIDVNSINMVVTNKGSFAYDFTTGAAGLYYPKGTTKTAVYESGLWLGALVGGDKRVTVAEYSQEYGPGAILPGGIWDNPQKPAYRVYKMARWSGNPADSAHVEHTPAEAAADPTLDPLIHHSWSEYVNGAKPYGAPTRIYRLPVTTTDDPTDSVDVEGPDVVGDQMLWSVYNDANPAPHTNEAGGTNPLGVEVQQTTFGFNRQGALGGTVFLKFLIINKGGNTLDNMYASLWADPDLGGADDDLVGCDTTLSLGFVYNATNNDQLYGQSPPSVGYDFFQGPRDPSGRILPLTSFNKYINGTDPASADETYNYMQGLNPDGSAVIDPTNGDTTTFFHPGDPVARTGWLDSNPADRRFMLSAGPFRMLPGDTQQVVAGIVIAQGSDRLASVTGLKFYDKSAQVAFDSLFNLPPPPPLPQVTVEETHGKIQLCWDSGSRFKYDAPTGYAFEGYNVYQGASVAGPWKRLVTYDLVNDIKVVRDTVFDASTGQLISDFPVAFGGDNGINYCYSTDQDAIRGGTLKDGTPYYFAVTAYAVGLGEEPRVLENAQTAIQVIPQRPALGTNLGSAATLCPVYARADQGLPQTTDKVGLEVVDPPAVTGHTYAITYAALPRDTVVGADTVRVGWNVYDLTRGVNLLPNQVNKSGDDDYRVVDGIRIKVSGTYAPANALNTVDYFGADCPVFALSTSPYLAVDGAGLESFGGGAGTAFNFFGGYDPVAEADSFSTVEVRFSHTVTQKGYVYYRRELESDGSAPSSGRGYVYGGQKTQPFTVWDTRHNVQLNVGFVEREFTDGAGNPTASQPASHDGVWGPTAADDGGREYFFVYNRPYTDAENPDLAQDGAVLSGVGPWEYSAWLRADTKGPTRQDGDVFRFVWGFTPGTQNDTIRFGTTPLVRGNAALAKTGLDRIRVVPNPYYNRSRYETSQFNRIMRFINMPEVATVRIFNLGGQLVRTIHKTDVTTSLLDWNLQTDNGLPVASGVYIYHVEAPGVGSTVGRLVVFMEKERLNNF